MSPAKGRSGFESCGCYLIGVSMENISAWIVAVLMMALGLIGLIMASGALDDEIYIFGLSLAGFAVLFCFGLIRRHFDRADAARARSRQP